MARFRTYLVGREPPCDVRLDHESVSRCHAEVVRLSDGRLFVTDRGSMNGTFVRVDGDWRVIRQTFVEPTAQVRFGACTMTGAQLLALCPWGDGRDEDNRGPAGGAGAPATDTMQNPVRDPQTGEVIERAGGGLRRSMRQRPTNAPGERR